jgi:hypothetical protein
MGEPWFPFVQIEDRTGQLALALAVPAKDINSLQTSQLRAYLAEHYGTPGDATITIRGVQESEFIPNATDCPISFATDLCNLPNTRPKRDFAFIITLTKGARQEPSLSFSLQVVDSQGVFIYRMRAILPMNRPDQIDRRTITSQVSAVHGISLKKVALFDTLGTPADPVPAHTFIHNLLHGYYYATIAASDRLRAAISNRVGAIEDLIRAEDEYFDMLRGFPANVEEAARRFKRILPDPLVSQIGSAVSTIVEQCGRVAGSLKQLQVDYYTIISAVLRGYAGIVDLSGKYLEAYRDLSNMFATIANVPPSQRILRDFGTTDSWEDMLLRPAQHPPRVMRLLRAVLCLTPPEHPDWGPLKDCAYSIGTSIQKSENGFLACDFSYLSRRAVDTGDAMEMMTRNLLGRFRVKQVHFFWILVFRGEAWLARINGSEDLSIDAKWPLGELTVSLVGASSVALMLSDKRGRGAYLPSVFARPGVARECRRPGTLLCDYV